MKIITTSDFAKKLGICLPSAYELLRSGKIPAVRCGRLWRTSEEALEKFVSGEWETDAQKPEPAEAA